MVSFLLLFLYLTAVEGNQRAHLRFPSPNKRLHDDPLPALRSPFGNKVYLKNKLLTNLNNFFPDTSETLEVFGATQNVREPSETSPATEYFSSSIQHTFVPRIGNTFQHAVLPVEFERNTFPTLTPTEGTTEPYTVVSSEAPKRRSEGPIASGGILDTIRDWRKRLYKAFKSNRRKQSLNQIVDTASPSQTNAVPISDVVDFKDITPIVVDKNRQILLSRKVPNWQSTNKNVQTFGRDPNGKMTRLFGAETSGYHTKPLNDSPSAQSSSDYLPQSPFSTSRQAYRIASGRNVVYVPASHVTQQPPPPVTAPVAVLPPLITLPYPQQSFVSEYLPQQQYTTTPPYWQQYSGYPSNTGQNHAGGNYVAATQALPTSQIGYGTVAPHDNDRYESYGGDSINSEDEEETCTGDLTCMNGQIVSEDRCNSMRLRTIIQNNIVANDAEASKRAVQSAAEEETGQYFNTICGTGFFSYIAHTDEFCLASMFGVNCYIFSPVCSGTSTAVFAKLRKLHRKTYLNKN